MDDRLARTISGVTDWQSLSRLETNIKGAGQLTAEVAGALRQQSARLARVYIEQKTDLKLIDLTEVEEKIVTVVSVYIGLARQRGKSVEYTLRQLKHRGLLGAAEAAVSGGSQTQGYKTLVEENRQDLSYEQIVVDHPEEFSPRAVWFARKTLDLPLGSASAPADIAGKVQARTEVLVEWLRARARTGGGRIEPYDNKSAAEVMGIDPQRAGRVHGNIQSRLDYACFVVDVPPLGLTALSSFLDAWAQQDRSWSYPVQAMQKAAQRWIWTDADFDRVLAETEKLPGQAHPIWLDAMSDNEAALRAWAERWTRETEDGARGTAPDDPRAEPLDEPQAPDDEPSKHNPRWSRDELLLALELYLKNRGSPSGKDSKEVDELSQFLNRLGSALGTVKEETFRNSNGVYMKMMNFRRFDPQFTNSGKVGLQRGNRDEEIVWNEFAHDLPRLSAVVLAIRVAVEQLGSGDEESLVDDAGIIEAIEGRLLTRLHRTRERSRKLVEEKKRRAREVHGRLHCEACGFDFSAYYGDWAAGIIDCHHTKPVHTLVAGATTRLDDLALLCANCHRAVHAGRPWLTVAELRERIRTAGA